MSYRVGIDLGTTNSVIAFTELGKQRCVKLDKNEFTSAVFPSCMAIDKGQPRYGGAARRTPGVVREFKRGIGRGASYQLGDKLHSSLELSAMLLSEIKNRFEVAHGPIQGAVITVPANFDDKKRTETKEAGRLAGLNVLRVINEPSAAAIAYSLSSRPPGENAVVIDWGGGTLDVSVVDCIAQVLDIKANDGEEYCGGLDIDRAILRLLGHKCRDQIGDRFADPSIQSDLLLACEQVKIRLSDEDVWDDPIVSRGLPNVVDFQLTRRELEQAILPHIEAVVGCVKRCLTRVPEGALAPSDVTDVILVGGSCFIPLLRTRIEQLFGKAPRMDLNPMEVVALGAAYQAEHAAKVGALVTLHSLARPLGVSCVGFDRRGVRRQNSFAPIIEAGTKIPARATHVFETMTDGQDSIRVSVYEPNESVDVVDNLEPWDTRVIEGLPNKPAGSFPIKITFDYSIDQCLTVTVEVESEGIKTSWTPQHVRRLQHSRAESAKAVESFRGLGIAPLREFRARLEIALAQHPSNQQINALLDQFDALLMNGDVASATKVKQELGVALFEAGIHL